MLTLISGTPSPFARINRIALLEKGIPFQLQNEVPWNSTTETPKYNPLEKLPILLFDDGRDPVYDSAHIQEYIVQKYADKEPSLLPNSIDDGLKARQIQVLAEGTMDAVSLHFFEEKREHKSLEWSARQNRKIDGGLKGLDELVKKKGSDDFLVAGVYSIADIAAGCAVGMIDFLDVRPGWKSMYPDLAQYYEKLETRETFQKTRPVKFQIMDKIV